MKFRIVFCILFFSGTNLVSQEVSAVMEVISAFEEEKRVREALGHAEILKAHIDFKFYHLLKKNYYRSDITVDEKEYILFTLQNLPTYMFYSTEFHFSAGEIYLWATRKRIEQYEGNLTNLKQIVIRSNHRVEVHHYLDPAILRADGTSGCRTCDVVNEPIRKRKTAMQEVTQYIEFPNDN